MDMKNNIFYKMIDTKMVLTEYTSAEYVILPIAEYDDLMVSEEMITSPDLVIINKKQYYGLENALRIVRNRGCQQVNKAKADKHGYTLKSCEKRKIDYDYDECAYFVTKDTPYSINMPFDDASVIIKRDLMDFYHYIEFPEFELSQSFNYKRKLTNREIIIAYSQMNSEYYKKQNFLLDNSLFGCNVKKFFDNILSKDFIFDITKFTTNYGNGTYQVSYLSTNFI